MYSAAAFLPSALPRSEIVTSRPPRGAGAAPVRWARCARIEGSFTPAAAASAALGGSAFETSWSARAIVLDASPDPRRSFRPWRRSRGASRAR
jgi:hypothetical protein